MKCGPLFVATVLLIISQFIWAGYNIFATIAMRNESIDSLLFATTRIILSTIVLCVIGSIRKVMIPQRKYWPTIFVLGFAMVTSNQTFSAFGVYLTNPVLAFVTPVCLRFLQTCPDDPRLARDDRIYFWPPSF